MAGAVIENLSTRKLVAMILGLFLLEVGVVLIGALIAPRPSMAIGPYALRSCIRNIKSNHTWEMPKNCEVYNLAGERTATNLRNPNDIVFSQVFPPSEKYAIIRWFQYMVAYITFEIKIEDPNYNPSAEMTLNLSLACTNQKSPFSDPSLWTMCAHSIEKRILSCGSDKTVGDEYHCEPIFAFQLGSLPYERYLLNMQIPVNESDHELSINHGISRIVDATITLITQTGGFTQVWLSIKTAFFIIMIFPVVWFWQRVAALARKSLLIEKAIFTLALSLIFLNMPVEFLTLYFDVPWMLLLTDIRQGIFYTVLFSFWVIFMGEHLMDQAHRNKISAYRWHLGSIFVASLAMLSFDLAERGMQIVNPFATIWTHPAFGYVLLGVGALAGFLYLILLVYLMYKVFRSIRYKRRFILPDERATHFKSIVSRLKKLMLLSVATAGLTVVCFFMEQNLEGGLHDIYDHPIEVTSAFFTGVYGLWNIYVFLVLSLYAPSHKLYDFSEDENLEDHELVALQSTTEHTHAPPQVLQMLQQKEEHED